MTDQASNISTADRPAPGGSELALDEAELIRQAQAGQMSAFGELVRRYQDRLYNVIFRMVGRRAEAEELTQEAFLKALRNIGRFRLSSRFYTWLFRIGVNLAISHRRRRMKVKFHSLASDGGDEDRGDPDGGQRTGELAERRNPGPVAQAMARETADRITAALGELDEPFRTALVLRDVEGMDYAEIGTVLDLPAGTVKSRIHRARTMLKDKLSDLVS
jgi:RNA polymerase sigma-70 factor (ECF subfamily)